MFKSFVLKIFLFVFLPSYALADKVPVIKPDGSSGWAILEDGFLLHLLARGIEFVSLDQMGERISQGSGPLHAFLGHHGDYHYRDAAFISARLSSALPLTLFPWDEISYVGVGAINSGLIGMFERVTRFAHELANSVPTYFLFMQRSEFSEFTNQFRNRPYAPGIPVVATVIPDFDSTATSPETAETLVVDTLLKARARNLRRVFEVIAFGGGQLEEAILARVVAETAYLNLSPRDLARDKSEFLSIEAWIHLSTGGGNGRCSSCPDFLSTSALHKSLPHRERVNLTFVDAREKATELVRFEGKHTGPLSSIVASRAESVLRRYVAHQPGSQNTDEFFQLDVQTDGVSTQRCGSKF